MSDQSEVEKILRNADKLKYLGANRAFLTILFALWTNRRRGWLSQVLRLVVLAGGAGGVGYWTGLFS
jgi:hypothetical protein